MRKNATRFRRCIRMVRSGGSACAVTLALTACTAGAGQGSAPLPSAEGLLAIETIVKALDVAAQDEAKVDPKVAQAVSALDAAWASYYAAASAGQNVSVAGVQAAAAALAVMLPVAQNAPKT